MQKPQTVTVLIHADHGVSVPKKIDPGPIRGNSPREKAEEAVATLKEAEISTWLERPGFEAGSWFEPYRTFTWQGLPDRNKLVVLEEAIDWKGVKDADKRAIFTRELDARQLPKDLCERFLSPEREPQRMSHERDKGRDR